MLIELHGAKNARDFSEYGFREHIRSAHLNKLTDRDAKLLAERYNVRTVVDLRTPEEVREKPDAPIPGAKNIHIPIFTGAIPGISHERGTDRLAGSIPDMAEMYRLLVTEEEYVSQLRKAMDVLVDPNREGAVLWHCTEGKDRCGIVSALFLLSHGVGREKVLADYLETNRVNARKARKYYILALLTGHENAEKIRGAFLAKREYIEPVMERLEELAEEYSEKCPK